MFICPNCSSETERSTCPMCGADIAGFLDESVCDITLTGFIDDSARQRVVEYLLSLSRSKNLEKIQRSIEKLPVKIYREIPQYKADEIIRRFEGMGAQIESNTRTRKVKVDEFFQEEFEEQQATDESTPPTVLASSRSRSWLMVALVVLAVAAAGLAYFVFLAPGGDRRDAPTRAEEKAGTVSPKKKVAQAGKPAPSRTSRLNQKRLIQNQKETRDGRNKMRKKSDRAGAKDLSRRTPLSRSRKAGSDKDALEETPKVGETGKTAPDIDWTPLLIKKPADLSLQTIEADETREEDAAFGHNQKGIELFGEQKYTEALEEFEAASSESPDREELVINVLNTLLTMGYDALSDKNYSEAKDVFDKALDYDPNDPFAHKALGIASLLDESYEEAAPHLEAALDASDEEADREVLLALGRVYALTNQSGRAIKYFEEYLKLNPGDTQVREYLEAIREG